MISCFSLPSGRITSVRQHAHLVLVFFFNGTEVCIQGFALAKQALYCLCHTFNPFFSGYFGNDILQIICPGWPQTAILLISASQVGRISHESHLLG
jgi:hypothetical protein